MTVFYKRVFLLFGIILSILIYGFGQVLVDEDYSDWGSQNLAYTDASNDAQSNQINFGRIWIDHNADYLFLSVEVNKEIIIQSNNNLILYIDTDDNPNTGSLVKGIGAELIYRFSNRRGTAEINQFNWTIFHSDIGLVTSPTVSSNRFEVAIRRNSLINGNAFNLSEKISVLMTDDRVNGDNIPSENGGIDYVFTQKEEPALPHFSLVKENSDNLRVLSYNVLRDGPWENQRDGAFERILRAVKPDIIAFQEIYNHSSSQTKEFVDQSLGGNKTWYHASSFSDNILVSKYPILKTEAIDGNLAFLLDVDGKEMMIISAHLPCCDNESGRQQEVDNIMSFVRRSKAKQSAIPLEEETPIIICGDMNFVGLKRQVETIVTGDIENNGAYGADFTPDWDGSDFVDLRPYTTGLPLSFTWYSENESFSPGRLDYVFYSGSVMRSVNSFALFTPALSQDELITFDLNINDAIFASDHLPLVVDFSFDLSSSIKPSFSPVSNIILSPNPVIDYAALTFDLVTTKMIQIDLVNSLGQKFSLQTQKKLNAGKQNIFVDLSTFPSGIYHVIISAEEQKRSIPVIKS